MRGDSLTVMAWQNAGDVAYYEAKCHIWCTSEGHLPGPNEKFTGNPQEFLNELVGVSALHAEFFIRLAYSTVERHD